MSDTPQPTEAESEIDYLNMSDDAFKAAEIEKESPQESKVTNEVIPPAEPDDKTQPADAQGTPAIDAPNAVADSGAKTPAEPKDTDNPLGLDLGDTQLERNAESDKAIVDALFQPIKADGKTFQAKSVDEAINLMQKGLNYERRSRDLRAKEKVVASLEKAGIKDPSELNLLIDVYQGKQEAITKLIAKHGIDSFDLPSVEDAENYVPNDHTIPDNVFTAESILRELERSEHYSKLVNTLVHEWDEATKEHFGTNPEAIRYLHMQMENGEFDVIKREMDGIRLRNQHNHLNDIQLFVAVGNELQRQGKLQPASPQSSAQTPDVVVQPAAPKKKVTHDASGVAPTVAGNTNTGSSDFSEIDFLNMSDAAFKAFKQKNGL